MGTKFRNSFKMTSLFLYPSLNSLKSEGLNFAPK